MSDADIVRNALANPTRHYAEALAALARMEEREKRLQRLLADEANASNRLAATNESQEWGAVEAEGELGFLRDERDRLKDQLAEAEANGLRLAEENERLLDGMYEWRDAADKYKAEVKRLRAEAKAAWLAEEERMKERKRLRDDINKMETERADMEREQAETETEIERLRTHHAAMFDEIERLRAALAQVIEALIDPGFDPYAAIAIARQALEGSTSEVRG